MLQASDAQWREVAALVAHMAKTGEGTDACYEAGALPLPVHFYSPVPDLADLDRRNVWDRKSPLKGIDMRLEAQKSLLREMAKAHAAECVWEEHPGPDPNRFYWRNHSFSFQCASQLLYFIRHFKPRRVIEIGSGMSSGVFGQALLANQAETGVACDYQIVDPYPNLAPEGFPALTCLHLQRVEVLDPAFFAQLGHNDILFIDSGHVVRIGSDVNFLFLEVLPMLAPGVIVHVHDISLPYEYPRVYFSNPAFRVLWTEAYLLQAFLMFNSAWEVLASVPYLTKEAPEVLAEIFPQDPSGIGSGSFWMRRKDNP
ncbi:MAG: class I SAM-dependent methyltransferase [Acidobacteria bacterium]|nr:class I SAM-dependent methyltransferase [Acidobacteriota bacterium]